MTKEMLQLEMRKILRRDREQMLADLAEFVKIPSVSADLPNVGHALHYILELGRSMGFEANSLLDGRVGVIQTGEGNETLGILAHVDVVAPGNDALWESPPFRPVIREGRMYGRGTLDDKGAIIASLYAMKAAREAGGPFKKKVQLILGTQEEVDWTDMREYVKAFPLPDYGFTPDGEFPLCNIEKGGLDLDLIFPLGETENSPSSNVLVTEGPGTSKPEAEGLELLALEAGTAFNIVPGSCRAILSGPNGSQTIEVSGKAVHSCQPEKGVNAIFLMADQLRDMELKENRLLNLLSMIQDRFADLYGEKLGLASESEYYNGEFVDKNVFSPTIFRADPTTARIHINARFPYGEDPERLIGKLKELASEFGGDTENPSILPAVYVSKDRPFISAFAEAYTEAAGLRNEFVLAYGGSYAKAMPNVVSWGPIFPGEEDTCHEENEYISLDSLMENAAIFAFAISNIVFSEASFR